MRRVLLLGGTTEASHMAKALHAAGIDTVFSYAGRTNAPVHQPVPTRIGGFGGVDGLSSYLHAEGVTHIIDATHPFAAGMSLNACTAARRTQVQLIRLERQPWSPTPQDQWQFFPDLDSIVAALPDTPTQVFLAIGKQHINLFRKAPQHHYLLRLVDAPTAPVDLPQCTVVLDRGPFTTNGDLALLTGHNITHIVAKNAGGTGAQAKLLAARIKGITVLLADRPPLPECTTASDPQTVMQWLDHSALRGV